MISAASPAAAVFPILGASVLVVGTGLAVGINSKRRRDLKREDKRGGREHDAQDSVSIDDEEEALPNTAVANTTGNDDKRSEQRPVRLPTVSAATSVLGSDTYILFIVTALVHGTCLILTSVFQRQVAMSDAIIPRYKTYAAAMGSIILGFAAVGGTSIALTSIVPAKGKTGCAHIAFGMIFINSTILYMICTCILTPLVGLGRAILVVRGFLTAFVCATMTASIYSTTKMMKLQGKEDTEEEWYWNMHLNAMAELTFGILYAIFLGTIAVDVRLGKE